MLPLPVSANCWRKARTCWVRKETVLMDNGETVLLDLEAQMQDIGLSLIAKRFNQIYRSPEYFGIDKLDLVSEILTPKYQDGTTKRL